MSVQQYRLIDYGLTNALQAVFPAPIVSNRAPTTADKAQIGTLWVESVDVNGVAVNAFWVLTSIINNLANWANGSGGSGSFTNLTANNLALPYTTAAVGRITYGGIITFVVKEPTSFFAGQAAGNVTYTGNHNVGVGELALSSLTTGSNNVAVGYDAGATITTGARNTLVGSLAGTIMSTGNDNIGIGSLALSAATTSVSNTIVGSGAGLNITTGTGLNTAIGFGALQAVTTGNTNIAVGAAALSAVVTGSNNIAIGAGAGANYTGAESGNIILGPDAGTLGESNVMRLSSNGGAVIATTGATNILELKTNGLVQVDAVLVNVASPTAALTANQRVIRARFTGFTTAAAGVQTFTLTSNQITLNGAVLVTVTNNNASTNGALMTVTGVTQSATTLAVTCTNNGAGALGLNDDVNVNVWLID